MVAEGILARVQLLVRTALLLPAFIVLLAWEILDPQEVYAHEYDEDVARGLIESAREDRHVR